MPPADAIEEKVRPSQVVTVESSERFVRFCPDLATEFIAFKRYRLARVVPLTIAVMAVISAFTLMHVRLSWFFLGRAFVVGFPAISVAVGDESDGSGPIHV